MITRSMVASARWVTSTADANSIHASLASAAGELAHSHDSCDDFCRKFRKLAALGKSKFRITPPGGSTHGTRQSASAKSITGVFQAQCPSGEKDPVYSPSQF